MFRRSRRLSMPPKQAAPNSGSVAMQDAMQQLAAAKNARSSLAIPPGVGRVEGPQKSMPEGMSVAPDVVSGGSFSIGPDGMPQITGPSDTMYRGLAPKAKPGQIIYKKGGKVKAKSTSKYSSGGSTSKASSRGDGIAQRGKTKGRMI